MNVVFSEDEMKKFLEEATRVSQVVSCFLLVTFTFSVNCYFVFMLFFFAQDVMMFFLFSSTHYSPKYRNEKTHMHLIIFGSLGLVEEEEDQWIFDQNRDLYDFSLQEQGCISTNLSVNELNAGQVIHGIPSLKGSPTIVITNKWRLPWFLILTPGEPFFALVNPATSIVNPLTHLLIFFILVHSICKLIKMFIILCSLNQLSPLPQLLLSPLALPECNPFKIYPVGLLICRPCTVEDKSNVFFLKAFKS